MQGCGTECPVIHSLLAMLGCPLTCYWWTSQKVGLKLTRADDKVNKGNVEMVFRNTVIGGCIGHANTAPRKMIAARSHKTTTNNTRPLMTTTEGDNRLKPTQTTLEILGAPSVFCVDKLIPVTNLAGTWQKVWAVLLHRGPCSSSLLCRLPCECKGVVLNVLSFTRCLPC